MNSTAEGTEPVADAGKKRFPATVATQERITELLRPGAADHLTRDGYVDTLRGQDVAAANRAQEVWQTAVGSVVYQRFLQPMMASLWAPGASSIADHLALRPGKTVADVGCGPGNVTRGLADAVRPHGLAVGLDLSEPMLTRASNTARPNTGLVRGDAADLPLRENSVDAACATAVIMLMPEPAQALAEMVRVTASGGHVLVMVPGRPAGPTASLAGPVSELVTRIGGARLFGADEVAILLEQLGCDRIYTYQQATMLTIRARTP